MLEIYHRTPESRSLRTYLEDNPVLMKAHDLAEKMHRGQTRAEGDPYFSHLYAVAQIIYEEWGIDDINILSAAFLHDTVEDTDLTPEEIIFLFGDRGGDIAFLVGGVTQFRSERNLTKAEVDHETLRKVFSKNLIDPRVGILKLADRLHNMRTLEPMPQEKRLAKSRETLEVYSSMAESLGIWVVKRELDNLALKYADPENFQKLRKLLEDDPRGNQHFIAFISSLLSTKLKNEGIEAEVSHRITSVARLKEKSKTRLFQDIDDVVSFRIVVDSGSMAETEMDTLKTLGIVWSEFREFEDPARFDNFYHAPRDNGYSAFQVTLDLPEGAIKIAITTKDKEDYNNWGIVSLIRKGKTELKEHALKLIFTPTGQVRFFPERANGYDFAYGIDERMGAQAIGMLINGEPADIATIIPNGATVEILVGGARLVPDKNAASHSLPRTRKKIERQFLELEMTDQEEAGRAILEKLIAPRGLMDLDDLLHIKEHAPGVVNLLYRLGAKRSLKRLYQALGSGVLSENDIVTELDHAGLTKEKLGITTVNIEGVDKAGLLNYYSSKIGDFGGNIRWIQGGSGDGNFIIHFVIEGLSLENEEKLKEFLSNDDQSEKVTLV